jgi:hypothetical protein
MYETHTGFWYESLKGRDHLGDIDMHGMIILKCSLKKSVCEDFDWIVMTKIG